MNKNVKIARELVKIAKILVAGGDAALKHDIEKELDKVKDDEVKNEIKNMINGSIKTASDWKDKVKQVIEWCKGHVITAGMVAALVTLILGSTGVLDKISGGNPQTMMDNIKYIATGLVGLGATGAVLTAIFEKICEYCGIRKHEDWGMIEQILVEATHSR